MTDTDRLAALLCDLFPTAERSRWPFSVQLAADRLRDAGVTLTAPAEGLRAAAQTMCRLWFAELRHEDEQVVRQAMLALRAALDADR